jgi:hypothetical protein
MKGKSVNICKNCGKSYFGRSCDVKSGRSKYCSIKCRHTCKVIPILERFWSKVNKSDDCWNWTAATNKKGYGIFDRDSGFATAHRYSYFLHFGEIPKNKIICHKCDNPKCVNPSHLFVGTIADNNKDKTNKNRQAKGAVTNKAKLTREDIIKIRKLTKNTTLRKIATMFNVAHSTISSIKLGYTWKHI